MTPQTQQKLCFKLFPCVFDLLDDGGSDDEYSTYTERTYKQQE